MVGLGGRGWAAVAVLAVAALLTGCDDGDGSPCVIDTDCADFTQACIDGRCQTPGAVPEAGTPMRDGGVADGGSVTPDAGVPTDGGASDAGTPMDGGGATDGGLCVDLTGGWQVSFVTAPASCGGAEVGRTSTIATTADCTYSVTSDDALAPAVDGTLLLDAERMVVPASTALGTGSNAPVSCTGVVDAPGTTITLSCDACVLNLTRR